MSDIYGFYNVSRVGRIKINGVMSDMTYIDKTLENVDLQNFGQNTVHPTYNELRGSAIDCKFWLESLTDGTYINFFLPNGYYMKLTRLSASGDIVYGQMDFYDNTDTYIQSGFGISAGDDVNISYFTLVRCDRVNSSDSYVSVMRVYQYTGDTQITANIERPLTEYQTMFDLDWITSEDPYITVPDSKPDGGYGDYDYSGDNIDIPSLPSWSITDSGFVTLYKPSLAQIKSLAQYLWTGIFDLATYKKIFADPMDCIISLSRVPIDADATGSQVLSVGNISTGLTFNVLSSQFVEVSFTSKNIGLRANGFLDYAPYVKVQLYLPFIGMRALSIDDIAGKVLTLKYQIDLFTGACTAYLKCKTTNSDGNEIDSVLYQFTGNVLANIPITQANYSSFIQSVIGAAAKTGSALISGGAAAAGAAAMSSGINVAANIKPDIERSGNMTATGGFLGVKKPYLIVTYPNICRPRNRDKTVAIPSFIGLGIQSDNSNLKLSDFKGLTILHKINVKKIPCSEVERQMIETQLMTEGVIL